MIGFNFTVAYIFQSEIIVFFPSFLWKFVCYFFGLTGYVSCYMLKLIPVHIYPSYYSMYPQIPADLLFFWTVVLLQVCAKFQIILYC